LFGGAQSEGQAGQVVVMEVVFATLGSIIEFVFTTATKLFLFLLEIYLSY